MKVKLVPTLLTSSFAEFKEKLEKLDDYFDLVQIDCADGEFVKNKTFYDIDKIKSLIFSSDLELHLMVKDPAKVIKKWQNYKRVKKIFFHYEAVKNDKKILGLIDYLKKRNIQAGLAISPETKLEKFKKFLPILDTILILGVNPGWGGQEFQPKVLNKIKEIRKAYPKLDIEVDGGVNLENAGEIVKAGANILAAGTLFTNIRNINKLIQLFK
ncbi:MAG: ribulose-phosphate 3-epimerase [Candidatus Parcubacteria bacterium]|nr:ribulose-phosphate 3-epimerase [Candidatus Parcubacteria bacterium]